MSVIFRSAHLWWVAVLIVIGSMVDQTDIMVDQTDIMVDQTDIMVDQTDIMVDQM